MWSVMRVIQVMLVTATCYHAVEGECDADYLVTASGARICCTDSAYFHRYVAVSKDLLEVFPMGSDIEVHMAEHPEYNGVWHVEDRMASRWERKIDFLVNPGMPLQNSKVWIATPIEK